MKHSKFLQDTRIRSTKLNNVKVTKDQQYFDSDLRRVPKKDELYPPILKMRN